MTLWCLSKAQDLCREGPNLIMMTIVDTLDNLSLQLKEQEQRMQAKLDELQTTVESRFREQEEKMDSKMEEFQTTMELRFGEQHELLSTLHECSSADQLSAFQDLFTKDECRDGSHTCSKTATCTDPLVPYKCACLTGYSGDGFTCQDIDECAAGNITCPENEECSNIPGNFRCICQNGYHRHGDSCQVCNSTDLYIKDLGCITLLNDSKMSWDDAKARCQASGKRLLENIKVEHLEPLMEHLLPVLSPKIEVWIGVKHSKWISTGETIDDALWISGQPNGGSEHCVVLFKSSSTRFGLADGECSWSFYSLCQLLL